MHAPSQTAMPYRVPALNAPSMTRSLVVQFVGVAIVPCGHTVTPFGTGQGGRPVLHGGAPGTYMQQADDARTHLALWDF